MVFTFLEITETKRIGHQILGNSLSLSLALCHSIRYWRSIKWKKRIKQSRRKKERLAWHIRTRREWEGERETSGTWKALSKHLISYNWITYVRTFHITMMWWEAAFQLNCKLKTERACVRVAWTIRNTLAKYVIEMTLYRQMRDGKWISTIFHGM